ncbi:MAG: ABC transporter permease [Anaerolineales bacterium]
MLTILAHAFSRSRGTLLGWGIGLGLLGAYLMPFYDTLVEQKDSLEQLLSSYPPEMLAFFGDTSNMTAMFTPEGYLGFEFFSYLPIILGLYAVLAGSGLLAGDEENGALDLLLAHPVSRSGMFVGRWLAFVLTVAGILSLAWTGLVIGRNWSTIELSNVALARPFLSLGAELLVFGALALLLSLLLPSRRLAATTAGLSLVASFFVTSLARINDDLDLLAKFSPLNYYQSGEAITQLNLEWLGGLLAVALALSLLAWWRFERRDIRVGGEGGWQLPFPIRMKFV